MNYGIKWLDHIDKILSNQDYQYVDPMKKARKITIDDSPETLKKLDDEQPQETESRDGEGQHDDLEIVKEIMSLVSDLPKTERSYY